MKHLDSIKNSIAQNTRHNVIARKVYITFPTFALIDKEDKEFEILNAISVFFKIPIFNIQVVGSAKTGVSFHKNTQFNPTTSDLDIAIIDPILFARYCDWVFIETDGFRDRAKFDTIDSFVRYKKYLSIGIFRPDLMPSGAKRAEWFRFFGKLSEKNNDIFNNINAGIYLSQTAFEFKQIDNIIQATENNFQYNYYDRL